MKFSEMPYARPDLDELKQQLQALTDQLRSAPDYASAHEVFLAQQKLSTHIDTLATLSSVRNSIDTRDKFYDAEEQFWNEAGPELRAYDDGTGPLVTATALGRGSFSAAPGETAPPPGRFDPERYGYLVIPDVSLQKARLARIHLAGKADIWSDNGYGFAVEEPEGVLGRTFAVESIEPYDPKRLKRELKGREAEVLKRDFPLAAEELMRRLGLHAGAGLRLAFTKIGNDFWVIRLK